MTSALDFIPAPSRRASVHIRGIEALAFAFAVIQVARDLRLRRKPDSEHIRRLGLPS